MTFSSLTFDVPLVKKYDFHGVGTWPIEQVAGFVDNVLEQHSAHVV
jgi:hypothetical protein